MNLTRLLAPMFVLAFSVVACSDGGGGGGGSATPCNNNSECPNGFECVANSNTNANPERPLSPGYTIQATCEQACAQAEAVCGDVDPSCVDGCKQSGLSEACLSCFLALPDFCSEEPDFAPCAAICSGGSGGSGGAAGTAGSGGSNTAGSGPIAGSGGSNTAGSGPVAGSGGNTGGTTSGGGNTSAGGSSNNAKSGVCRAIPNNNQGGSNQGGSGGSGGGGVSCSALCSKASGCQGFDANTCATNCPQVSENCRVCINNASNICDTVALSGNACANECSSGGPGGSGGSDAGSGGSGGSDAGSSGSGGSNTSSNTCTLNGTKYNCPSPEAAQKCFDDFAPGECTPA